MGRWLAVRVIAWALRHGIDEATVERALQSAFSHRDDDWRDDVIMAAWSRNERRKVRA